MIVNEEKKRYLFCFKFENDQHHVISMECSRSELDEFSKVFAKQFEGNSQVCMLNNMEKIVRWPKGYFLFRPQKLIALSIEEEQMACKAATTETKQSAVLS